MSYQPPFAITNEILNRCVSITKKIERLHIDELSKEPHLRRANRIRSIHASAKIEANSLSLDQVADLVNGKLVVGEQKDILEIQNAMKAYEQISSVDPYSVDDLLTTHQILTKGLVAECGKFRSGEEGVFAGEQCIFVAPPARFVASQIKDLLLWLKNNQDVHPLIASSIFHYEFVFIHPFADGNGRMARLWQTILLYQWNPNFAYIPLESQIEKFQEEYYHAISACHTSGDSTVFIAFILKMIDTILDDHSIYDDGEEIPSNVWRLLAIMEEGKAYSRKELMELLHLKSVPTFNANYLSVALQGDYIRRTIPQSPKSKNQKYVRGSGK